MRQNSFHQRFFFFFLGLKRGAFIQVIELVQPATLASETRRSNKQVGGTLAQLGFYCCGPLRPSWLQSLLRDGNAALEGWRMGAREQQLQQTVIVPPMASISCRSWH